MTLNVSPTDLDLVRFVASDRDEALENWRRWSGSVDIDQHSAAVYPLFPAVHRRLEALGEMHVWKNRLKGTARQHWLKGQLHSRQYERVHHVLRNAGIDHMVPLETARFAWLAGGDSLDVAAPRVLVKEAQALNGLQAMAAAGWHVPSGRESSALSNWTRSSWTLTGRDRSQTVLRTRRGSGPAVMPDLDRIWEHSLATGRAHESRPARQHLLPLILLDELEAPGLGWLLAAIQTGPSGHRLIRVDRSTGLLESAADKVSARIALLQQIDERIWPDLEDVARSQPLLIGTLRKKQRTLSRLHAQCGGVTGLLAHRALQRASSE